jgi:hydroxyacid-oxoacid transhydrogenase
LDGLGVPRGLKAVGYSKEDIPMLVEGTLPQRRVLDLAPGVGDVAGEDGREHLTRILEASLNYWKCLQTDFWQPWGRSHYLIHGKL